METALKGAILNHLQQTAAISAAQHGFIPRRSNLLIAEERITRLMDSREGVNLQRPSTWLTMHRMLCEKMLDYGTHRSIVDWTRSFLFNSTLQVRILESYSAQVPACSGVPQGSALGPILFLIFVNDLPDVLSGSVLLFADDAKLISARSQYGELHQNPEAAFQWSDNYDLPLNTSKCSHISIGGPPPSESFRRNGNIGGGFH